MREIWFRQRRKLSSKRRIFLLSVCPTRCFADTSAIGQYYKQHDKEQLLNSNRREPIREEGVNGPFIGSCWEKRISYEKYCHGILNLVWRKRTATPKANIFNWCDRKWSSSLSCFLPRDCPKQDDPFFSLSLVKSLCNARAAAASSWSSSCSSLYSFAINS